MSFYCGISSIGFLLKYPVFHHWLLEQSTIPLPGLPIPLPPSRLPPPIPVTALTSKRGPPPFHSKQNPLNNAFHGRAASSAQDLPSSSRSSMPTLQVQGSSATGSVQCVQMHTEQESNGDSETFGCDLNECVYVCSSEQCTLQMWPFLYVFWLRDANLPFVEAVSSLPCLHTRRDQNIQGIIASFVLFLWKESLVLVEPCAFDDDSFCTLTLSSKAYSTRLIRAQAKYFSVLICVWPLLGLFNENSVRLEAN
ncbi:hypothetical protein DICVIV_13824 [Dictyocaulus viviparus]|uniref:Uncharacterized protein n=1 Tax=Dictyocaulus viviparus TaxID=29172 RepID=A0A0D8XCU0_DICVI|nr:hypothetical protein DICVIV_13824 [Dictyocaulus viviparus]